jgi:adenylosuccinate lyase
VIDRYSRPEMKKIWSDETKYANWLEVELAVCEAWTNEGVVPPEDMIKLRSAKFNQALMDEAFEITHHDVTAFLHSVTSTLGNEGRWIHLGLTSSDVMDTALSLQLVGAADILLEDLQLLKDAIKSKAVQYKNCIMMGRTHGIHAEPTTFGLKLALWWDELRRQQERLLRAKESIRVGKISGAVGSHATVPPNVEEAVCAQLNLGVAPVSNQIIQRDRHAEFVTTLALIAASLEKFATEIRHLQRSEVREVEEPFAKGQTGSSAMPHKRNPELSERVCGLARLIRGYSVTALENVALWHERDISHSSSERLILPDSCLALDYILNLFTGVIVGLKVHTDRMNINLKATKGVIFSQRLMLTLIEKGMSRDDSYKIVQKTAMISWDEGKEFRKLIDNEPDVLKHLSPNDLDTLFDYSYYMKYVDDVFERVGLRPNA